jgi:ribosomal protein S18 acetylase RimI-like enzyme
MNISDYDRVFELWTRTPGMGLNNIDDSRVGIDRYLRRNPETCFVAEEAGEIVGAILAGHDGRRGYIHHTAVAVSSRRKGVGTALVENAMEALKNEGIIKTALVVFAHNEIGNEFWENRQFLKRIDLIYRNKSMAVIGRIDT